MHYLYNNCKREVITNPQNHRVCGKLVQTHIIKNPKISDIKRKIHDYIIDHNKKNEYYTNEVIFKKEFETIDFFLIILRPLT